MNRRTVVFVMAMIVLGTLAWPAAARSTGEIGGPAAVQGAAAKAPPDLAGSWGLVVANSKGKTVATGSADFDATAGTFSGSGVDGQGQPFTFTGAYTQTGRKVEGTLTADTAQGTQVFTVTGASNGGGTRMKWKLVETEGPLVGGKDKVRLARPL